MDERAQFHQVASEVAWAISSVDFQRAVKLLGSGSCFGEVSNRPVAAIQQLQHEAAPA